MKGAANNRDKNNGLMQFLLEAAGRCTILCYL